MSYTMTDIHHMQVWIFRKAQVKWNVSPQKCVQLFKKHEIFKYISECYELLHVSSYDSALAEVEEILRANGEQIIRSDRYEHQS